MTGSARDAYHAVPHVLSHEEDRDAFGSSTPPSEKYASARYLDHHRININIRQVVSVAHSWPELAPAAP